MKGFKIKHQGGKKDKKRGNQHFRTVKPDTVETKKSYEVVGQHRETYHEMYKHLTITTHLPAS